MRILAISGSYRRGATIDQAVEAAAEGARAAGAEVEIIRLSERSIEYCDNCRACMQPPGEARGACHKQDGVAAILEAADRADGYILGAPVNFFNANALTRTFLERLAPCVYWPWVAKTPAMRLRPGRKRAVLIASAAMPAPLGRLFTGALGALGHIAAAFGARKAGTLFIGMSASAAKPELTAGDRRAAGRLGRRLVR